MRHVLKTWPKYYEKMISGEKTFELRKADRPFKVGDTLLLQEFDTTKPIIEQYSGREIEFEITYIFGDRETLDGLFRDYVIMSLKPRLDTSY